MINKEKIMRIHYDDYKEIGKVHALLNAQGLNFEKTVSETYGLYIEKQLVATGSIFDNVLKMIAVDSKYQGTNIINILMSYLISLASSYGKTHLFIYTTPLKYKSFEYFGFSRVESTDGVVLLENKPFGLKKFLEQLKKSNQNPVESAAIVVNCNPFTLGHRYLIERASKENKKVHVFVLWENYSTFPNSIRYRLLSEGVRDLKNVEIHWARDYIISSATFPSYFVGGREEVVAEHTQLDVKIFGRHIAPALNISKRYIGEEPLNPITRRYNDAIKAMLPNYGIEVCELPRIAKKGKPISASSVRLFIAKDRWEDIRRIVPKSTWDYLISEEAATTIRKIKHEYKPEKWV